jgi:hypothetical protein
VRIEEALNELKALNVTPIVGGGVFVESVYRNRAPLRDYARPALYLFDGPEDIGSPVGGYTTQRSTFSRPAFMVMHPQVFAVLNQRIPDKSDEYGPLLSQYRIALIKTLLEDSELISLVTSNGQIAYQGYDTDMKTLSSMEGQLQMLFAFTYPLITSEL